MTTIWIVFILLAVAQQWYKIEVQKKSPNYKISMTIRVVVFLVLSAIGFYIYRSFEWLAYFTAFQTFSFWFIFDTGLNIFRGDKLSYLGTGSVIDKFIVSHFERQLFMIWLFKGWLFISATILYINYMYPGFLY